MAGQGAYPLLYRDERACEELSVIRVVVVDDEALVRSGFELILRAAGDIDVVATATGRSRRASLTSCCWTSGCRTSMG